MSQYRVHLLSIFPFHVSCLGYLFFNTYHTGDFILYYILRVPFTPRGASITQLLIFGHLYLSFFLPSVAFTASSLHTLVAPRRVD